MRDAPTIELTADDLIGRHKTETLNAAAPTFEDITDKN